MTHEDMFSSRGFRGLNITPFPRHIKEQIKHGYIRRADAAKFMKQNGRTDYTNYEKVNEEAKHKAIESSSSLTDSSKDEWSPSMKKKNRDIEVSLEGTNSGNRSNRQKSLKRSMSL